MNQDFNLDPALDLEIERVIAAPRALVWRAWTTPDLLRQWWAPRPWTTPECEIELRPGGRFLTVMRGPEGEEYRGDGCILHVEQEHRIVFTDTLSRGWRPADAPFFSAIVTMSDADGGTRYTARAVHGTEAGRKRHAEMGFMEGWGTVAGQLEEIAVALKG